MPHINIEYNDAIDNALNIAAFIADVHDCAMSLEALPTGGIRTRGYLTNISNVGDGAAENGFIYITIRLGQGRNETVKKDIGDQIFAVLTDFTQDHFDANRPISLGLEIQEIEKDWTWKKNNIHQILKDKNNGPK